MRYMGGKSKIAKQLAEIMKPYINDTKLYIEPFCGSSKVTEKVTDAVNDDVEIHASDTNEYLITLFISLQNGWNPPKELSEETYKFLKENPDLDKSLAAFAGFGCSWGGKWFGGYAKCKRGENFALETYNSLLKQKEKLKNVRFECKEYTDWAPENAVVYCDPPYANTTGYTVNKGFDSNKFWEAMREWSKKNIVFISEYSAPDDFICIYQREIKTELRNSDNKRDERIEKLFIHQSL